MNCFVLIQTTSIKLKHVKGFRTVVGGCGLFNDAVISGNIAQNGMMVNEKLPRNDIEGSGCGLI
jgi:hypothetical protein